MRRRWERRARRAAQVAEWRRELRQVWDAPQMRGVVVVVGLLLALLLALLARATAEVVMHMLAI